MRVGWRDLSSAWRLPGRALGLGLPLTLQVTALLAHWVAGLDWPRALLIGAVLSPTTRCSPPLVGTTRSRPGWRHLLNVESGINDALPCRSSSFSWRRRWIPRHCHCRPWPPNSARCRYRGRRPLGGNPAGAHPVFAVSKQYLPQNAVAIGLLFLDLGKSTHANCSWPRSPRDHGGDHRPA